MASEPAPWTAERGIPLVTRLLPQPVERIDAPGGVTLLTGGDPGLVALRINAAAIRVGVFAQKWWGDKPVLVDETLVAIPWSRLPADASATEEVLGHFIAAAVAMRKSRFFDCERCRERRPPEWLHAHRAGPAPCRMCGFDEA